MMKPRRKKWIIIGVLFVFWVTAVIAVTCQTWLRTKLAWEYSRTRNAEGTFETVVYQCPRLPWESKGWDKGYFLSVDLATGEKSEAMYTWNSKMTEAFELWAEADDLWTWRDLLPPQMFL